MPDLAPTSSRWRRAVIAAAHPDDESLGAGALAGLLHDRDIEVVLVLATAGESSHPRSPTTTSQDMAARRLGEASQAWAELGGTVDQARFLGLPDGGLDRAEKALVAALVDEIGDGRDTVLVVPWRNDGHPDHDALGRAGRIAAFRTGAHLLQYPVWFWHHGQPADAPWTRFVAIDMERAQIDQKARAIRAHRTQTSPLSPERGDETLLGPDLLQHFLGQREVFVVEEPADDALDLLHGEHDDPWGTRTRWYEQRRQDLILAALPRDRFRRALDIGCSVGTLTAALAERCEAVVATDRSPIAAEAARRRLAEHPHVEVRLAEVPTEWPDGEFDLVLVSEAGYFLTPPALDQLIDQVASSLGSDGCVVLAHWSHEILGWPMDGPEVHRRFAAHAGLPPVIARYADVNVEILVHSHEGAPSP